MSELSKNYDSKGVEEKWYANWLKEKAFSVQPSDEKQPSTIVIPPPNVTGILHMGHALNNTIQDVLIRMWRMQGKMRCGCPAPTTLELPPRTWWNESSSSRAKAVMISIATLSSTRSGGGRRNMAAPSSTS